MRRSDWAEMPGTVASFSRVGLGQPLHPEATIPVGMNDAFPRHSVQFNTPGVSESTVPEVLSLTHRREAAVAVSPSRPAASSTEVSESDSRLRAANENRVDLDRSFAAIIGERIESISLLGIELIDHP